MNIGPYPQLTLHRASAGSGKTYALTKIFLRLFLSISSKGKRRLRTIPELNDSLSHILAITFTNKATAEMKQRIISALANIADYEPGVSEETPDYFTDFIEEFHTTPTKLKEQAHKGLEILLNNFSDFKVSTIDSFFQSVLRTFAYETNLRDNYGVEIETDYINHLAIDTMMEQIDRAQDSDDDVKFWFSLLMDEYRMNGNAWNVFQKQESNGIYSNLKSALRKFELEDYKEAREGLDKVSSKELRDTYTIMEKKVADGKAELAKKAKETAQRILEVAAKGGFSEEDLAANLKKWCPQIINDSFPESIPARTGSFLSSKLKSKNKGFEADNVALDALLWQQVKEYLDYGQTWSIYRVLFPYLALMNTGRQYISDMMTDNNAIVLAETNSLLRKVISDDDTPFIYERLGSRLNHLLIDEFQDTSGLQWENLRPLIGNALGYAYDSLLIGDAKQSIYRFRNANPEIIMKTVPQDFPAPTVRGESTEENTNYRSDEHIVQFNNLMFSRLPGILDARPKNTNPQFFRDLYATAVQQTKRGIGRGYVRIEYISSGAKEDEIESVETEPGDSYSQLGELITSMLSRGYRQRDIAILVRTKDQARKAIDALIDYNTNNGNDQTPINFVSEESLSISSSKSVDTIINCLKNIASAASLKSDLKNGGNLAQDEAPKYVDWQKIAAELSFFVCTNPDMSPDQQIEAFFAQPEHTDELGNMVRGMQSTALPALVEALAKAFVHDSILHKETPFLAAFQDAVLDYSSSHISDIGSFLNWWEIRGKNLSIASPADTEAVQVMTVHKSKGIEFKCVIIPECDWATKSMVKQKDRQEWKWVRPEIELPEGAVLPDLIPVLLNSDLEDTPHYGDYLEYCRAIIMDSLNALYVAFTRAVNELYIYLPEKKETKKVSKKKNEETDSTVSELKERLGHILPDILLDFKQNDSVPSGYDPELFPDPDEIKVSPEGVIEYGLPLRAEEVQGLIAKEKNKENLSRKITEIIDDYPINTSLSFLKYKEEATGLYANTQILRPSEEGNSPKEETKEQPNEVDKEDDWYEEDNNPRSEGNLLHSVMQAMETEKDLEQALLLMKSTGYIPFSKVPEYRERIQAGLDFIRPLGWFDKGLKVLNERPILTAGELQTRPDRIIVNPKTNEAVIIDYKFGDKAVRINKDGSYTVPRKHINQVAGYVSRLRKTGLYSKVSGFLWYVPFGIVHEVKGFKPSRIKK